ncbi:HAAS signaling domain-containing protein [Actinoplanes sp. NPDC049599]|uniref:HAAS signaling domain-containing protein n=1 Tax=Actinoplanes sp. NPDC049599 TaxID=3363903 RepID=UPI0037AACAAF
MSSNKTDDAVAEYLRELELRLTGLPVLQRRELLAEIEAHISTERVDRGVTSESDLLELLERLGSPEVVAAAAYEEAGMLEPRLVHAGTTRTAVRPLPVVAPPPDSPPPAYLGPFPPASASFGAHRPYSVPPVAGPPFAPPPAPRKESDTGLRLVIGFAIATVVFVLLGCVAGGFLLTSSTGGAPAPVVEQVEPARPAPPALPDQPAPTAE